MRISDWSSDVCSSDHPDSAHDQADGCHRPQQRGHYLRRSGYGVGDLPGVEDVEIVGLTRCRVPLFAKQRGQRRLHVAGFIGGIHRNHRSEEHTSELQSLMRISYAVFCLKKKKKNYTKNTITLTRKRTNTSDTNTLT